MDFETDSDAPIDETIVDRVAMVLEDAERTARPVEHDPHRGQLFEAFVTADAAGLLDRESSPNLVADELFRRIGERWGLSDAARSSAESQQQLSPEHRARMRVLWSAVRMWMEWQYAWDRWPEFHQG